MRDENLVMTYPITERINTELFIDERAGLYIWYLGARKVWVKVKRVKNVGAKTNKS